MEKSLRRSGGRRDSTPNRVLANYRGRRIQSIIAQEVWFCSFYLILTATNHKCFVWYLFIYLFLSHQHENRLISLNAYSYRKYISKMPQLHSSVVAIQWLFKVVEHLRQKLYRIYLFVLTLIVAWWNTDFIKRYPHIFFEFPLQSYRLSQVTCLFFLNLSLVTCSVILINYFN